MKKLPKNAPAPEEVECYQGSDDLYWYVAIVICTVVLVALMVRQIYGKTTKFCSNKCSANCIPRKVRQRDKITGRWLALNEKK